MGRMSMTASRALQPTSRRVSVAKLALTRSDVGRRIGADVHSITLQPTRRCVAMATPTRSGAGRRICAGADVRLRRCHRSSQM